ncbi:RbsD/FucU family protein [Georgenia muralis]|uniref:L-fucose mutarotase n=1 Tax=Georgenia muralis TaxID=154117 RepID=A0A3N4ZYU8_9MICO|nr:RbsD/FucU domain-containing protein [Georgenia muralis]RPF26245.1 L-fucose mutarotase [Georgenia muralis]
MLTGINPLLTGAMLKPLDEMGHSDLVAVVDANFPAHRFAAECVEVPGVDVVTMTRAIREVFPIDADNPPVLMDSGAAALTPVQEELLDAAGSQDRVLVDRWSYYDLVERARLIISTGELRLWANVVLAKGLPHSR